MTPSSKGSTSGTESTRQGPLTIDLRIHDYARVPRRILVAATRETARIFQDVGVEVLWTECPVSPWSSLRFPDCRQYQDSTHFDLNIVPRAVSALRSSTLAFTPMSREGERASVSDIFYERVREQAETLHSSVKQVLGHVMAHGMGHLLLRMSQHSSAGIMRAQWTVADLSHAAQGLLLFTPEQAQLIRAEVILRGKENGFAERPTVPNDDQQGNPAGPAARSCWSGNHRS